ncbi:MAG: transglutaminase domain-containing protein [Devosia sp.]
MQIAIRHELRFSLGTPARAVAHLLLTPLATPQQRVERWSVDMPGISQAAQFRDGFGNKAHLVSLQKPDEWINVVVEATAETTDKAGVIGRLDLDPMPAMYRRATAASPVEGELIAGLGEIKDRIARLHELMGRIHARLPATHQTQLQADQSQSQGTVKAAVECAHAFVGAARALDVPARYVTGYLLDDDLSGFHSWAEAWDDGLGWIGFDPLLDVCPADNHVRLASGLDARGTMPIRTVPVWSAMPDEIVTVEAL